jgi:hypothetical protein
MGEGDGREEEGDGDPSSKNVSELNATNALRSAKLQEVKMPESKDVRAAVMASRTSSCVACETVATTL